MTDMADRIEIVSADASATNSRSCCCPTRRGRARDLLVRTGLADHVVLPELSALQRRVDEHNRHGTSTTTP